MLAIFAQQGHGQVAQTAVANGAKRNILFGLGRSHHVGKSLVFIAHIGRQHHGRCAHQDERHNVLLAVVRHVGNQALVHTVGVEDHRKGIAVRGCRQNAGGSNDARRAAFVFHHNALAQLLGKHRRNNSRHLVNRAARRKHGHQFDGLLGGPSL